jgi:hypothetical protein
MTDPNIIMTVTPYNVQREPSAKELADLEDAARDFGSRIARLRALGVPDMALLRTYTTTCAMCGQQSLLDAVAALPKV